MTAETLTCDPSRACVERTPNPADIQPPTGISAFDSGTRALFRGRLVWVIAVIGQMTARLVNGHLVVDETPADKRVIWWATAQYTATQPVNVTQLSPVSDSDEETDCE